MKRQETSQNLHILQSKKWESFQETLKKQTIMSENKRYSFLAVVEETPIGKYLFVPYGPYLVNENALAPAITELKIVAKEHDAFFIRIEPTIFIPEKHLRLLGARKSKNIDPAETWVFEIPETKEQLLSKLPKRLRGYYNTHGKKGIEIIQSHNPDDIQYLVKLQNKIFSEKNIQPFKEEYLKQELAQDFSTLYLAKFEDKIIAAILVFDHENTRYYMQAASDKNYSKLNANGIITIQSIIDAYEKKLAFYDFWGIAPSDAGPNHPWAGFTAFKKMFQGEEIRYSGTYDIPVNSFKYYLYKILRKIKYRK